MQSNYKKLIPKLLFSLAMLIVAGVLIYNNFLKKEEYFFSLPREIERQDLYVKFDLDIFESPVFQDLMAAKKLTLPPAQNIGRENPFLKF